MLKTTWARRASRMYATRLPTRFGMNLRSRVRTRWRTASTEGTSAAFKNLREADVATIQCDLAQPPASITNGQSPATAPRGRQPQLKGAPRGSTDQVFPR